jgi:hypothetical protein
VRRIDRLLVAAVIAVSTAFSVVYSRVTPLGQAPDETSHLDNIVRLALHLQLPPVTVPEHKQPPLFYLLGAGVYRATEDARVVRLVSVVAGVATLLVIYAAATRLFPSRRLVPVGAVALFALLPEMQYISGSVNDDALAWLFGATVLLCIIVALQRPALDERFLATCGVMSGLALLSKETVWVLIALLALVLLLRLGRRLSLLAVAAYLLPLAAVSGWWFARNLRAFHALTPPLFNILGRPQYLHSLSQARLFLAASFDSTLGSYGNGQQLRVLEVLGAHAVPSTLVGAVIAVCAGVVAVACVHAVPGWDGRRRRVAATLAVAAAAVVAQYVLNSVTVDLQPQARYLMVAAVVFASATAWAAARLFSRRLLATAVPLLVLLLLLLDVSGVMTASKLPA